jgi:hypothetical protein
MHRKWDPGANLIRRKELLSSQALSLVISSEAGSETLQPARPSKSTDSDTNESLLKTQIFKGINTVKGVLTNLANSGRNYDLRWFTDAMQYRFAIN